ncbi:MAG: aspartate--tRNA ligase [Thermodesulfobacteriota bacterium]
MIDSMEGWKRTHYCGEIGKHLIGQEVVIMGWVNRRRDHGGLLFIDLRDREGMVQAVFNPETNPASHTKAQTLRNEFVVAIKGKVSIRPEETANPNLKTGEVEIIAEEIRILNKAQTPPFSIEDEGEVSEFLRLKYRYLDLRKQTLQKNFILRHKLTKKVRDFLSDKGFLEIETPMLTKSTPEGARDYLVPSRVNPGHFYALPQSPQLFKQILMISGFDKYFQIARCFRDEDLRKDRQPEFTQVDIEMSFIGQEEIFGLMEEMMAGIITEALGKEVNAPFPRMTYEESIKRFGLDTPDIRYGLELQDITSVIKDTDFMVFKKTVEKGGMVKAINAKGCSGFSRKELDDLTQFVGVYGAKGLAWIKITEDGWSSPIAKFFGEEVRKGIDNLLKGEDGDIYLFVADSSQVVNASLGNLRINLAKRLDLIPSDTYSFIWVTDFPLLEYDEDEKRHTAIHHPFTAPLDEDIKKLDTAPLEVKARAYDVVLNGIEIGGGSLRIYQKDIQTKVFEKLGIGEEEAKEKFGFLLEAMDYGAPPHGGIALGLDRLVAIICGVDSIRDVIAFPKTQKALCLMTYAPSEVDKRQLDELSIRNLKLK